MMKCLVIAICLYSILRSICSAAATDGPPSPIPLPGEFPYGLAWDGNALWACDFKTQQLHRIDLPTRQATSVARLAVKSPSGLSFDGHRFWLVSLGKTVYQVQPETGVCTPWGEVEGKAPTGLACDGERLFVADRETREITCLNVRTKQVERRFPTPGLWPRGLLLHDGALWCLDSADRAAYKLDPQTGRVLASFMPPEGRPRGMACVNGIWWFTDVATRALVPAVVEDVPHGMRSNPVTVRVTYTDTFENLSPSAVEKVSFRLAVPFDSPRQTILKFRIGPEDVKFRQDRFGQKIAFYQLDRVNPGKKVKVEWVAEARIWAIRYTVPDSLQTGLDDVPEAIRLPYTASTAACPLADELVRSAAKDAVGEERRYVPLALRIRDYVLGRLSYDRDGKWEPANEVLKRGTGSCSEYSYVFSALARAHGLPTRFVGGSVWGRPEPTQGEEEKSESQRFVDRVFHRWVETYVPPIGWLPLDANRDDAKQLTFLPGKGGECTDFVDKRIGKRFLMPGEGALLGNRVWNYADAELYQQWQKARWEHEVRKAANEVTLVMRAPGQVGFTRSCVFEKRVTLRDGEALARVEHVFHVGQELMVPQQIGLWFYNRCGVPNERNTYFMPLDEGVASVDAASGIGQTWQYTPSRGWLAFVSESGDGLCFGMEYRRLMCFYLCAGRQPTFEWAFRTFEVKNGDSFRTEELIMPFHDLKRVDGAGGGVVAAVIAPEKVALADGQKGIAAQVMLAAGLKQKGELVIQCRRLPDGPEREALRQIVELGPQKVASANLTLKADQEGTWLLSGRVLSVGG